MWHRLTASVLILPVLHRARLGESRAMALCPLGFVPSLPDNAQDTVKRGQAGSGLAWMWFGWPLRQSPCSFMWERGSVASNQPLKQPGWPVAPGMSRCRLCLGKRRRRGSPIPGLPGNSSFHLSLPGKLQPSHRRRGRSCRDGSCDTARSYAVSPHHPGGCAPCTERPCWVPEERGQPCPASLSLVLPH